MNLGLDWTCTSIMLIPMGSTFLRFSTNHEEKLFFLHDKIIYSNDEVDKWNIDYAWATHTNVGGYMKGYFNEYYFLRVMG